MKILTVSASPYLKTKLGSINKSLLSYFAKENQVATCSWHFDKSYYLDNESDKKYYYEDVCRVFPINTDISVSVKEVYKAIKEFQPDAVVSIGDIHETNFIGSIKQSSGINFKWLAVLTEGTRYAIKSNNYLLENADEIMVTCRAAKLKLPNDIKVSVLNPGINHSEFFQDGRKNDFFTIAANLKNCQSSNIMACLEGLRILKDRYNIPFRAYLHTNVNDIGDYSLLKFIDDNRLGDHVYLPKCFVSVQEGPGPEYLRDIYSKSHVFMDCSTKSSTAMNMLESMACGCIPIVSNCGALGEILSDFRYGQDYMIDGCDFIGDHHENICIISASKLAESLKNAYALWDKNALKENIEKSVKIAQRFVRNDFELRIDEIVSRIVSNRQMCLVVEEVL